MTDAPVICPVCGHANAAGQLFCQQCIAPLAVQSLAELSPDDLHHSLTNLLDILASERRAAEKRESPPAADALWLAYLNAFWLRPASALAQYLEARALQQHLARFPAAPLLEIGPGSGIHSALVHGWRFDPLFDAYQALALDAADIYDAAPGESFRPVVTHTGDPIALGVDIKTSMVQRARALGVFRQVMQGSALALPLAPGSVGAIYSNMLRDFEDDRLAQALGECRRVLRQNGCLHLAAPTESFRNLLYYYPQARALDTAGDSAAAARALRLDRGRHAFCVQQIPVEAWAEKLAAHRLTLVEVTPFASRAVLRLWDTGWRPFTPLLAPLAAEWQRSGALALFKPMIVAGLNALLSPFLTGEPDAEPGLMILTARAG